MTLINGFCIKLPEVLKDTVGSGLMCLKEYVSLRLSDPSWEGRPHAGGLEGAEGEGGADVEGVEEGSEEEQGENGRKHPHG